MLSKAIETPRYKLSLHYYDDKGYVLAWGEDYRYTEVLGRITYDYASDCFENKLVALQGN